ncbi:radical SAM protein [Calditrichota bacterium]
MITLFGGEPLLEYKLIKEIVEYSKHNNGSQVDFRISTNGTLLTREMLDFFQSNRIYFTLSLDGNRQQHDSLRKFPNDRGSFDTIDAKLDDILAFNRYTMAVSVVTPETVDMVADGVKSLFKRGFRYVLQTLDYSAPWKDDSIKSLKKQYLQLVEYYYKSLTDGKKIYYSPFDERIKTWAQKPYGKGDLCDIANTQLAIAPSGRIYPCVQFIGEDNEEESVNSIGDVYNGFDIDKRKYFIEKNYSDREPCNGCVLNGRCANYCGCVNWRATGEIDRIPPIICEHERMLMPIVDRLANKLWKRNNSLFKRKFYDKSFPVSSYIEDCLIMKGGVKDGN